MQFIKSKITGRIAALFAILALLGGAAIAVAGPANAATTSRTCTATDSGYRMRVVVEYDKANGLVDVHAINTYFEHRTLGIWKSEDWASSSSDSYHVDAVLKASGTRNPGKSYRWVPGRPAYTYDPPVYTNSTASGSGTSIASCTIGI